LHILSAPGRAIVLFDSLVTAFDRPKTKVPMHVHLRMDSANCWLPQKVTDALSHLFAMNALEKSDVLPFYKVYDGPVIRTNMNMNVDVGNGLALTMYERNDPHPIEYVNHVPRLVVETTTTATTTTALMVPLLEPLHNESDQRHRRSMQPPPAPRNRVGLTTLAGTSHSSITTTALKPLRKIARVIQKIATAMNKDREVSSPSLSERSLLFPTESKHTNNKNKHNNNNRTVQGSRTRAEARSLNSESESEKIGRNVAPRMGQNGRLVAVPVVGKDRGDGGKANDTSSFTRRLSTANTTMLEHVGAPMSTPTTLEAALIQIRQLELQNKALSKQVDKNTSRQQHMVVTLAKIGTRIVDACDKVHVVLNEHDEQMMTDQMNAMETLIKYRGMGGGGGNGQ
jgi:hypothetical protein